MCGCTGDGRRGERQLRGRGVRPGLTKSGLAACARGCTSTTQEVLAAAASRRGSGATSAASPKQRPAPRVSGCPGLSFDESSTWCAWVELLRATIDARFESGVTRVQALGSKLRSRGGGGGVTRRAGVGGVGGHLALEDCEGRLRPRALAHEHGVARAAAQLPRLERREDLLLLQPSPERAAVGAAHLAQSAPRCRCEARRVDLVPLAARQRALSASLEAIGRRRRRVQAVLPEECRRARGWRQVAQGRHLALSRSCETRR